MEWQTDSDIRPRYVVYLGVTDADGSRVAAYEAGVWGYDQREQAKAFALAALGRPAQEAVRGLRGPISAETYDADPTALGNIVQGSTVEEFTENGTQYVWDFEFTNGEAVLADHYSYLDGSKRKEF